MRDIPEHLEGAAVVDPQTRIDLAMRRHDKPQDERNADAPATGLHLQNDRSEAPIASGEGNALRYDQVAFEVRGVPAAKGSPHARVHNGHVVMHEGKKTKSWERLVREAIAVDVFDGSMPAVPLFVDKPLKVELVFRLTRPGGHWGKSGIKASSPPRPHKKPDIDKLARSTLDPMIGSIFDDDSRIVELVVTKIYADPGDEGVAIRVTEWRAE